MKKILIVCTTDSMIWNFLKSHINELEKRGYEVECACSKTGFFFDELIDEYHFQLSEIPFCRFPFKFKNIKCFFMLNKLVKRGNYDLIFCHEPVGGAMGRIVGRINKKKVVYMAHGFHFYKGGPIIKNFVFKSIEKYLSKFTNVLITINDEDYQATKQFRIKKNGYIVKLDGIGIDLEKYKYTAGFKEKKRNDLKISADVNVFITVGELSNRKNMKIAISSFLKSEIPNSVLLVCGEGPQREILSSLVSTENNEKVKFLGFRRDIPELLKASDFFLFCSKQEGLCIAGIEAMACGLPLICSNSRGIREYAVNGKTGLTCKYDDEESFISNLKSISENPKIYKILSENAINFSKKYSIEKIKKEIADIIEWEIKNEKIKKPFKE